MGKITPLWAIDRLRSMSPCPIIHSVYELPENDPRHGRPSRSRYFNRRSGRWARKQDYILVKIQPRTNWKYMNILAHELGHALDYHNVHPAQHMLRGSRSGRYRQELAAVSFQYAIVYETGLHKMKSGKRWLEIARRYLYKYERGNHPTLVDVLSEMKHSIL